MTKGTTIRALIVDDEPPGRTLIRKMLHGSAEIEVVAECENGYEAIAAVESLHPDLLFLDVQMPEIDGFSVLEALPAEHLPYVIFVTAYDQYAVRAFEVHALDYLLKPYGRERFRQALERAKHQILTEGSQSLSRQLRTLIAENRSQQQYLERLIIKTEGRVFFLKTAEIEWIKAEGNYVALHVGKTNYLFRESISSLETRLDPRKFQRIGRSAIVNIDCIRELQSWFHGDYKVILHNNTELKLSHRYRENLQRHLGGSL